jgi:hypothetical protein
MSKLMFTTPSQYPCPNSGTPLHPTPASCVYVLQYTLVNFTLCSFTVILQKNLEIDSRGRPESLFFKGAIFKNVFHFWNSEKTKVHTTSYIGKISINRL